MGNEDNSEESEREQGAREGWGDGVMDMGKSRVASEGG